MTNRQQLLLFIAFSLIAVSIFSFSISQTQTRQVAQKLGAADPSPVAQNYYQQLHAAKCRSRYQLTSPGILPTHPLYGFKMIRDRAILTFTTNPAAKTSMLLVYADRRMAAAEQLLLKARVDPTVSVATKGMDYYRQAIAKASLLPAAAQPETIQALVNSNRKYEAILAQMDQVIEGSSQNQVNKLTEDLKLYRQTIDNLSGQKQRYECD